MSPDIQKIADVDVGIPETPTPLDSANVGNGDIPPHQKCWRLLEAKKKYDGSTQFGSPLKCANLCSKI